MTNEEVSESGARVLKNGSVLIFGDTHFSAQYKGTHKNYEENSYRVMALIIEKCKAEPNLVGVILLGDVIGVKERNISAAHHQFLLRVINFFKEVKALCGGVPVQAVEGNHDQGEFTDFALMIGLGLMENPDHLDYWGGDSHEVRFHFMNYGDEERTLKQVEGASNVVLGHNDFQVDGVTNWYGGDSRSLVVSKMHNLIGVDMLISGHIHTPSPEVIHTRVGDSEIDVFYPGSPARVAERYEQCFYLQFGFDASSDSTLFDARLIELWPVSEEFHPEEDYIVDDDAAELKANNLKLTEIIQQIIGGRLTTGDPLAQIQIVPGFSQEAKDTATRYFQQAIREGA